MLQTVRVRLKSGRTLQLTIGSHGNTLELRLWLAMTHAGMKPVIVETKSLGEGKYAPRTSNSQWAATGLIVRATLTDGSTAAQQVSLKGVQGEMKMEMKSDKAKEGN